MLAGKKILIFQQRGWGQAVGRALARKLHSEGCRLAALTFKKTTHSRILRQSQEEFPYELIIFAEDMLADPLKFLNGDKFSLKDICQDLGVDTIWPLVNCERLLVQTYKEKYYYSFRQNVSDERIVDYVMAIYKCIRIFFERFKPEVIVAPNFSPAIHLMFNLYAEKQGVTMLAPIESKIKGQDHIFIYDYKGTKGPFFDRVDLLNKGLVQSENLKRARQYIQEFKTEFKKIMPVDYFPKKTLWQRIKYETQPYRHILSWYIKRPDYPLKSLGPTYEYRPPRIILRDHYCQKLYRRFMKKYNYYHFDKVEKFVYFPLQLQPEILLEVISPYVSNQIETARQVAMSLPDDYTLVVKEHPSMVGVRSPSYLEKVSRTPNVKLIDYRISTETILKRADLIVTPGGTTAAEAAFLAFPKPVIQLGDMGLTLKLPNVFKHSDLTTLSAKIKEVLSLELNTPAYQKKLENYVAAVYDTGYYLDYAKMWDKDMIDTFCNVYIKEIKRVIGRTKI